MVFINPQLDILVISGVLSIASQGLQRLLTDRKKMKENQEKMKEHQKKMRELSQKQDKKSIEEMEKLEKEFMEAFNQTMQASFKFMIFSLPVFGAAFWFLGNNYETASIDLPVPVPWFVASGIKIPLLGEIGIQLFSSTNWLGWYVLCSIAISLVLSTIINAIEKAGKK